MSAYLGELTEKAYDIVSKLFSAISISSPRKLIKKVYNLNKINSILFYLLS